jgi:hypothetical protein
VAGRGVLVLAALEDGDFARIYGVDGLPDAMERIAKSEFEPAARAHRRAG